MKIMKNEKVIKPLFTKRQILLRLNAQVDVLLENYEQNKQSITLQAITKRIELIKELRQQKGRFDSRDFVKKYKYVMNYN